MDKRVQRIYLSIYIINAIITLFLSITIYLTVYEICDDYKAREFLENAKYLPHVPWKVPWYSAVLFLTLAVSDLIKKRALKESNWAKFLIFIFDLAVCAYLTYNLNFSYKGIFLLLTAGLFVHLPDLRFRMAALTATLICFIIFDYDLLTVRINMVSFQDFLNYYAPQVQISLYGVRSTLSSANLILVILFFYVLIQSKIRENKEFVDLNSRLTENIRELEFASMKLEEAAKMRERNRLAHEIHDILGHSLTCISTGLEASLQWVPTTESILSKQMAKIKEISDKGLLDIRRSIRELKKDVVESDSLLVATKQIVDNMNSLGKQRVSVHVSGQHLTLADDVEMAVFRMIQESLTNSVRHGKADTIQVHIQFNIDRLNVVIEDDGVGTNTIEKNFGLDHITERITAIGGDVTFKSARGKGFRTDVVLPLNRSEL